MKGLLLICPQVTLIIILELKHLFHFLQLTDFLYMLQITSSQVFGESEVCSCTYAQRVWLGWSWDLGTEASVVLWFRFVTKTELIAHPCFIRGSHSPKAAFFSLCPFSAETYFKQWDFRTHVLFLEYLFFQLFRPAHTLH